MRTKFNYRKLEFSNEREFKLKTKDIKLPITYDYNYFLNCKENIYIISRAGIYIGFMIVVEKPSIISKIVLKSIKAVKYIEIDYVQNPEIKMLESILSDINMYFFMKENMHYTEFYDSFDQKTNMIYNRLNYRPQFYVYSYFFKNKEDTKCNKYIRNYVKSKFMTDQTYYSEEMHCMYFIMKDIEIDLDNLAYYIESDYFKSIVPEKSEILLYTLEKLPEKFSKIGLKLERVFYMKNSIEEIKTSLEKNYLDIYQIFNTDSNRILYQDYLTKYRQYKNNTEIEFDKNYTWFSVKRLGIFAGLVQLDLDTDTIENIYIDPYFKSLTQLEYEIEDYLKEIE